MGAPRPAAPDGIRPVAGPDAVGAADTAVISILPQAVPPSADPSGQDDPYGSSWPDGSAAPVPRGPDVADSDADDGALADEDDDDEEGDAG